MAKRKEHFECERDSINGCHVSCGEFHFNVIFNGDLNDETFPEVPDDECHEFVEQMVACLNQHFRRKAA